jgi:hypothetical protein
MDHDWIEGKPNIPVVSDEEIQKRLQKYTTGSLSEVFDEHTNIELDNRLVVFDTKDLPEWRSF